jgi:hypothetical protein
MNPFALSLSKGIHQTRYGIGSSGKIANSETIQHN